MMDDETRKIVLVAYQKRKQEEIVHPFLGDKTTVGLPPPPPGGAARPPSARRPRRLSSFSLEVIAWERCHDGPVSYDVSTVNAAGPPASAPRGQDLPRLWPTRSELRLRVPRRSHAVGAAPAPPPPRVQGRGGQPALLPAGQPLERPCRALRHQDRAGSRRPHRRLNLGL